MATKPVGTPTLFAPDANYPAGLDPWSGGATKTITGGAGSVGFVPGQPVNAQELNAAINQGTVYDFWLSEGSSAPLVAARIVETDNNGDAGIASLTVGGVASPLFAFNVTENSTANSVTAVLQNTSGNDGLQIEVVGGAGTGLSSTTNDGDALRGTVAGNGSVLVGTVAGTGTGVEITSGGRAGEFTTTGPAVAALTGTLPGGATLAAIAVSGVGAGLGTGVRGTAESGYGVIAESDPTNPARAALRTVPQAGDPSVPLPGDSVYNTQTGPSGGPRTYRNAWHSLHTSPKGFVQGTATQAGATLAGNSSSANLAVITLQGLDTLSGGSLRVAVDFDVGASAGPFTLRINDITGGLVVKAVRAYPAPAMSAYRSISYKAVITASDNLARIYSVTLETDSATALDYGPINHYVHGTF
jgi:hypothetical protein